jgi:hypothetical protein
MTKFVGLQFGWSDEMATPPKTISQCSRRRSMKEALFNMTALRNLALIFLLSATWPMPAQENVARYPSMAPSEQYMMDRDAEVALARSAAPESISRDAEVLILGRKGYETVIKGKNGFVCMVARSWMSPFTSQEFWNPKIRGPECYNPPAVQSFLPYAVKETAMALSGLSNSQIRDGIKAAVDKKELGVPAPGSLIYMMSKDAYFTDNNNPIFCHLMFDLPSMNAAAWGANQEGTPVFFQQLDPLPVTEFYVVMGKCSDGSPGTGAGNPGSHSQTH